MKSTDQVLWKRISGYPMYEVSNDGAVRSYHFAHIHGEPYLMSVLHDSYGYPLVSLKKHKGVHERSNRLRVHRLVADAFVSNPYNKPCVNHIDGNPKNNHYSNLEWVTHLENIQHARLIGGFDDRCKMTEKMVLELRKDYDDGKITITQAEKVYPVNKTSIHNIVHRKSWKHI